MNEQSSYWHIGRKHPVHNPTVESGNQAIIVFVTVNTHRRKPILAEQDARKHFLKLGMKQIPGWSDVMSLCLITFTFSARLATGR
ncbi:MAG TPA: hypothetical protein VG077_17690 [Verrucomicrobiae bacterium]|nr:hypothetical protein [Verrucomicrobiae bacterium]